MPKKSRTVYLLHLTPPYRHARHYLGYTDQLPEERLKDHLEGRGSPLIRAAVGIGVEVTLARVWKRKSRTFERELKNKKNAPKLCPICSAVSDNTCKP